MSEAQSPGHTVSPAMEERGSSLWRDALVRLRKNRLAVGGLIALSALVVLSLLTPWIAPYGYEEQDLALGASPPSPGHWFGTDLLGRDLFTRMLYGGRISLMVGFTATGVSLCVGVLYGACAGYAGGRTDAAMMRLVDILYSLPFVIFVIILTVFFGRNIVLLFMAIGAVEWLTMARIVRGQVMSLRQKEFIEAATIMGLPRYRVLLWHLIPNTLGPIIVYATLTVPRVMLLEAFLSYLGLGVQAPMSSWGLLINEGVQTMEYYPWMLVFPSVALSLTLFALNFLGDGLRDALDVRASKD
ncbi:MAG TPA: ABC transporter permease subunit [Candidatus Hydrogenedentes bacterium]|nr:ABC transporter permease subunit [Candidatus Hydrogenedentota bacterium]